MNRNYTRAQVLDQNFSTEEVEGNEEEVAEEEEEVSEEDNFT